MSPATFACWFPEDVLDKFNSVILARESLTARERSTLIALGAGFGLEDEVREMLDKAPECVMGGLLYLPSPDEVEL